MKAHIGHIDNRKRISKELKNFSFQNRPLPYQRSSISSAIFFPMKSTERGLGAFHDPNRNFRFPASFGRRKRLLRVVRDRRQQHFCVRGTRTQPIICVGCSVHYWVTCAINKGGFFEIAFSFVVDTHLPRFEALA